MADLLRRQRAPGASPTSRVEWPELRPGPSVSARAPPAAPSASSGTTRAPSGPRSGRRAAASGRSRRAGPRLAGAKTAAGGPSATTTPSRMTTIRPKRVAANSMSWVMATTVRPAASHRLDDGADPRDAVGVLAGRRLVEDEHGRVHRQDAGQRDELAARQVEVVRVRRALVGQADGVEAARRRARRSRRPATRGCAARTRPRARPSARRAARRGSGRRTRRSRRARRSGGSSVGWPSRRTRPLGRPQEAVEVLDERRLARAVLAEDRDRLAGLDGQRHAADGLDAGRVAMDEVLDGDPDGRAGRGRASSAGRPGRRRGRRRGAPGRRAARQARPRSRPRRRRRPGARRRPRASRTSVGAGGPTRGLGRRRAPRPGRSSAIVPPAVEHEAAVHPPEDARVVLGAQDRVPARASSSRSSATDAVPAGSSWAVGSSRTRTFVPIATMLAIATRCCSPPDSANGSRSARWPIDRRSRVASIRASISARGTPRFSSPNASSSRTVSFDADSWLAGVAKTIPTRPRSAPARRAVARRRRRSRRARSTFARTTRGMKPAAASASVDLPAPVRPATADALARRDRRPTPSRLGSRRPG